MPYPVTVERHHSEHGGELNDHDMGTGALHPISTFAGVLSTKMVKANFMFAEIGYMQKHAARFYAALFICGVLVIPLLHQAGLCFPDGDCTSASEFHGDHAHEGNPSDSDEEDHDHDSCAICQLLATPIISCCCAIAGVALIPLDQPLQLAPIMAVSRLDYGIFQARAPPCLPSV